MVFKKGHVPKNKGTGKPKLPKKKAVSGAGCKRKGSNFELDMVKRFIAAGIHAEKVPLSGAVKGGAFEGDIHAYLRGSQKRVECKIRLRAWNDLYAFLEGVDILCIRRSGKGPLIVMPADTFLPLISDGI